MLPRYRDEKKEPPKSRTRLWVVLAAVVVVFLVTQLLVLELAFPNVKYLEPDEGGQGREHVLAADPAHAREWDALLAKAGDGELPKPPGDEYAEQIEPYAERPKPKPAHPRKANPVRARGAAANPDSDHQRHLALFGEQERNQPNGNHHDRRRKPSRGGAAAGAARPGEVDANHVGRGIAEAALAVHEVVALDQDHKKQQADHLRGVAETDAARYNGAVGTRFVCGDGTDIPIDAVNDDFCDCTDGSDEPGTSACEQSSFYCHNLGHASLRIPSYRVNDGVCDCCDGTDEWHSGPKSSEACRNSCDDHAKAAEALARQREAGRQRRAEYAAEGQRHAGGGDTAQWGPDMAFYKLTQGPDAGGCFVSLISGYTYNVCFFSKVEQQEKGANNNNLGRSWTWDVPGESGTFTGGTKCWNGPERQTRVEFKCGEDDKVTGFTEVEKCSYLMKFETPAACT